MRLILLAALAWSFVPSPMPVPEANPEDVSDADVLGELMVQGSRRNAPRLMKLMVPQVVGTGGPSALVDEIVRRDLDLSGQFELLESAPPEALEDIEAIVQVSIAYPGEMRVELRAKTFFDVFDVQAEAPAYESTIVGSIGELRALTHQLVDATIGTLTGSPGPFASRLTFVANRGDTRTVYVIDPDGHGLEPITRAEEFASSSAFGPEDELYYSASVDHGRFQIYRAGQNEPVAIEPEGSVYGIAFSPDRQRVALTIAVRGNIQLYAGASTFADLEPVGALPLTMSPTVANTGAIAVAGTTELGSRIWVDGDPVSPAGIEASAPDICERPGDTRLVYALGGRDRSSIVVSDVHGRDRQRITREGGRDSHPACSPDGRLVAFFSTRVSGDGPGLYIMRTDGAHARKIANVRGDSLNWSRVGSSESPSP